MRLLGIIKNIGEARQWMTQTGPVTIYPVTFEAEGNTFLGDLFASRDYIANRGIVPNAVGYFDITFKVRDVPSKTTGEVYKRQDIRFSDFRLANQNLTNGTQTPATEAAPAAPETQAPQAPTDGAQEGTINPETGLSF